MKKTTLVKILSIVCSLVLLCFVAVVPVFADSPEFEIELKDDFSINKTIRTIFNCLALVILIVCVGAGGVQIGLGAARGNDKERNDGLMILIIGAGVAVVMLTVLNVIIK